MTAHPISGQRHQNRGVFLYFVKYPEPGRVKSRLASTIGDERAARLYRELAENNFNLLKKIRKSLQFDLVVVYDPPEKASEIKNWLSGADGYRVQKGDGLGERLSSAFDEAFAFCEDDRVVVLGSDTLNLSEQVIHSAVESLTHHDVVIGPAKDGGYYLLASRSNHADLFKNISWSTGKVLDETLEKIKALDLSCRLIKVCRDLDTEEDLYAANAYEE